MNSRLSKDSQDEMVKKGKVKGNKRQMIGGEKAPKPGRSKKG